jgi:formylglycine-generating enzyme required for sulfatase activity
MILAALMLMIACGDDTNKTPVDNTPVQDDTAGADDTIVPDDQSDTEQPDETVDTQLDGPTDDVSPDTEQPDVDYGTGTPGEMVDIPAGEFQMGCNPAVETECYINERPYHAVTLSAYKIGKYEVTVGEYQKCITNGACNNNGEYYHYNTKSADSYCNLGATGKDDHPMQCVTWYGAKAYCEWVGQRLPTEAEWEKAARGTDGRKYPWGNEPTVSCDHAVMEDSDAGGAGCGAGNTMPVGSKPNGASPYGAYDMLGNVWEWVNDWYGETYYETSPTNNPTGPDSGDYRVLRGGAWYSVKIIDLRASARSAYSPDYAHSYGFRCAE